jgi:hypothetical protein
MKFNAQQRCIVPSSSREWDSKAEKKSSTPSHFILHASSPITPDACFERSPV